MESEKKKIFIGIRREDQSCWERRTALIPDHVAEIIKQNPDIGFVVQPSNFRVFSQTEYEEAGAEINDDLSQCSLVIGVKEVPTNCLFPDQTYMFFSHTIKGQLDNMPMLDDILKKRIRLIDYERIVNQKEERQVAFGRFAGIAGAIDFLCGFGTYLLKMGFSTNFLNINFSYQYHDIEEAFQHISEIGKKITKNKLPKQLCPMIFANIGTGRCANGTMEVLKLLNIEIIKPEDMRKLVDNPDDPKHREIIYVTTITTEHMVQESMGNPFNKKDYYENPGSYEPIFHQKYLPFISVLFNNIYWDQRYPRLIEDNQIKELAEKKKSRLLGIADVTCDKVGSIEFLKQFTTPDAPFFMWDPTEKKVIDQICYQQNIILYLALDFLPCELAFDASTHFSMYVKLVVPSIARSNPQLPLSKQEIPGEIKKAVIANDGELTEAYTYISNLRVINQMKKKNTSYDEKRAIAPLKRKVSSFMALRIKGHLFDTMAINEIFNICQEQGIKFNILDLVAGTNNDIPSQCVVQIFDNNQHGMMEAIQKIMDLAEEKGFDINQSGKDHSPR